LVSYFYGYEATMAQFAYHVQRRLIFMPATTTYYHSLIPDSLYKWFHPKVLMTRDGISKTEITRLATELRADPTKCIKHAEIFIKYAPYGLSGSATIRLLPGMPGSDFSVFLHAAIFHHPSNVVRSLRHGSDQITASSFFASFWVSKYTIEPYFNVRFSFMVFSSPFRLISLQPSRETFVHAINTVRAKVTEIVDELLGHVVVPSDADALEYEWLDQLSHAGPDEITSEETFLDPLDFKQVAQPSAVVIEREAKSMKSFQSSLLKSKILLGSDDKPDPHMAMLMDSMIDVRSPLSSFAVFSFPYFLFLANGSEARRNVRPRR